ncbi:S-layer homology domain-containing protein [Crassaminicella profunda]|uniref:S-layer homology domain-containing protein n=1 Tax=Crassaminicella profunda TaxID=1286698 RepID=UPI001CA73179|nr:S-layer homology domain-containing protein [Crassaminicella profunda]QZY57245.1 S-layer homology domain-containing protein [Crassaminicella profunda]
MKKRTLCLMVTLMLLMGSFTSFAITKEEAQGWYYGNASAWAYEELIDAVTNGIVLDPALLEDCKKNITRQEFAKLAVNLYKATKKNNPIPAPTSTFTDTKDPSVRIAYKLGIINGVGGGKFAPNNPITREQMGAMILNAVKALGVKYEKGDGILVMTDKADVSSWAINGVDFVYESGLMRGDGIKFNPKSTTPIEQAVAITNRVYKKYAGSVTVAKNDYRKGYKTVIENDGLYVKFNNTGNKEPIVKYGEEFKTTNNFRMELSKVSDVQITMDYRKVYFLDEDGRLFSYDVKKDSYYNYIDELGFISGYALVEKGKYEGYYLVRPKGDSGAIAYDTNLEKVGQVYTLDPYTVEGYIEAAYNFSFDIEEEKHYTMKKYGGRWNKGKTLNMTIDNRSDGPIALVANKFENPIVYRSSGIYETTMKFNNEEHSNAGIVFNVTRANVGNDQYTGYYVGLSPKNDTVLVGWSNYKWNMLKEVKLGFDVKKGRNYNIRVEKIGGHIDVYVEGKKYISVRNELLDVDGYIGVRGWNADVDYVSFSAEKVPF